MATGYRRVLDNPVRVPTWKSAPMSLHVLHHDGLHVLVRTSSAIPAIVHWGEGPRGSGGLDGAGAVVQRPRPAGALDVEPDLGILPEAAVGFAGPPGLECHRADGLVLPRLSLATWEATADRCSFRAEDPAAGVAVDGTIRVGEVIAVDLRVTNTGDEPLFVQRVAPTLPLPARADEVLRLTGHWCREFQPLRLPWVAGTHVVESRSGRTSHDAVPVIFAGPVGFGEAHGDVRGVHLAWSGNHSLRVDRLADGRRLVQAAELLLPGEVVLEPGGTYAAPTVLAAAGEGLGPVSRRFHRHLRGRLPARARPVVLNTWEAVYFDHDHDTLLHLADRAAAVGVERFVLDDGWFGGRRDDTAGLGDWWVSPDAHPGGLGPLIDHVTGLGMEFGIWVEPEMVNPDSDLYRAHPDWVLGRSDVLGRHQLVLDLAIPACWEHVHDQLDRLLTDHTISFVKWDHNRDLAGAGAHAQTLAVYRLLDALRAAHPGVEIETCASGGGRADFGILSRTERVWTSDCNDPLERQDIQRGFSLLFPPEVMGAHIGPPRAHTTGRVHRLSFRAATALFGHLGIEWNLLDASERDLDKLRGWVELYKRLRPLLHGGDVVRLDHPDPACLAHGVVASDRTEAVFALAQLRTSRHAAPAPLVLDGLDPDRTYTLERLQGPGEVLGLTAEQPAWIERPVARLGGVAHDGRAAAAAPAARECPAAAAHHADLSPRARTWRRSGVLPSHV